MVPHLIGFVKVSVRSRILERNIKMVLDDLEVESRLNSLDNLVNRLRRLDNIEEKTDASLAVFIPAEQEAIKQSDITALPPSSEELIEDLEAKLRKNNIKLLASDVLENSLESLRYRLDEVDKVRDLSRIASDMGKILTSIDPPKESDKTAKNQVIIYKPVMVQESHYNSLQVNE